MHEKSLGDRFINNALDLIHNVTGRNPTRTVGIASVLSIAAAAGSWIGADKGIAKLTSDEQTVVVTNIAPDSYQPLLPIQAFEPNRRVVEYHPLSGTEAEYDSQKAITLDAGKMKVGDTVKVDTHYRLYNRLATKRLTLKQ